MRTVTSAYANKLLRKLSEEKSFWVNKEADASTYVASVDEEPVIPEYNYMEVANTIAEIDSQVVKIKHALNVNNVNNKIVVNGKEMTIDEVLVAMAQLSQRKDILDGMRKQEPKRRIGSDYISRRAVPEYKYINYDLELIKKEYERVDMQIADMQIALDKYNQTFEFEIDI